MEKKERIIQFDLLRVVAIFAMMMLHVAASQFDSVAVGSSEWFWFNFYDSIVRFCVPVLVMISGIFFLDPKRTYSTEEECLQTGHGIFLLGILLCFGRCLFGISDISYGICAESCEKYVYGQVSFMVCIHDDRSVSAGADNAEDCGE